jgi:hypothetical protein
MSINSNLNNGKGPTLPFSSFNDERLKRAVEDTKSTIAERNRNLDRISEDIKKLERYLDESGVRERIQHCFDSGQVVLAEPWELEFAGEAAAEEVAEFLIWEERQGRWRITYLKRKRCGGFSDCVGWYFGDEQEVIDHRPLIEAPAIIRLRASEVLPDFLMAVAENMTGPKTRAEKSRQYWDAFFKTVEKEAKKRKRTTSAASSKKAATSTTAGTKEPA